MKDLRAKVNTKAEVKVALKEWAEEQDRDFTTQEAIEEVMDRSGNVWLNKNRVAQYLRGNDTHEYHGGLKKWIKIRK